ncbi:GNAT family N-acetyltransferase [Roseiconus nitratireducens]|uniref:GNAT family N-acetyltransferase n=1 Tax=Roseiconus nitratireducens TaxID=2605748 RepID=A0A5M6D6H5_9BACT|nr:GNAT family N-acetyltransferase [Roseiconus nitratireducens]KAA5543134.1 GNAT family N-acetyltransferase [Roseiconus nitratireducens]
MCSDQPPARIGPETERLVHRAFTIADAAAFLTLNGNPAVMRFTGEPLISSLDEAREAIAAYPDFDVVGFGRWACVLKRTQRVIGFCGLKYLPDLDAVDVGYRFLPEYWGQGLATEACNASLRYGFETLGLDEVIALVLPANGASIRVLEKVGMRMQGETMYDGQRTLRFAKQAAGLESEAAGE